MKHKGKLLFAAGLVLGFGLAALWFEREVIFEKFALGQETASVTEDSDADGLSGSDKADSQSELDSVPCDSESVDCGDSETDYDDSSSDTSTAETISDVNGNSGSDDTGDVRPDMTLRLLGTRLADINGNEKRLRGVSTHGINVYPQFVDYEGFKTLRDEWGVNLIRLSMYTQEDNGYCSGGNRDELKSLIDKGVSYATDLNMYVIIDWHILSDGDPNIHKEDSKEFFSEMSSKYADNSNVLYEICNEPNNTSWWNVKEYANTIIPIIRSNDENAIIIVGTPDWCQDPYSALNEPITGYDNIMYAMHFYSATHKDDLRNKFMDAVNRGLPVFCSEFGTTRADGNGEYDFDEAKAWIDFMNNSAVSYCIWNLSNKDESSALIAPGSQKLSHWSDSELTEEGKWYKKLLNEGR